ncbi:glucagon-1-like isoform X2 [Phyllopteryx taeniolatus]|uniref:glucagon-1-like isoform X2 n=1 Tax=Phyllopteryx taeniolatus TaxID=161469 RepID=UPI002AD1E355|nr:glucagon-1-like isoform X2 [Phyllopteryx taeniolatus]
MANIRSLAGLLVVLSFVQTSCQVPLQDISSAVEKRHAEGTYTSDVSSYLQDQALKDFVAGLVSGQIRREWDAKMHDRAFNRRRHVDGSFTSDVNKVLDSMAAKEFLLWVMTSKSSGESKRRQAEH